MNAAGGFFSAIDRAVDKILYDETPTDSNSVCRIACSNTQKQVSFYPVNQRCDSLILHGLLDPEVSPVFYNLILHVPGEDKLYSLLRTDDLEEAEKEFILFKECLVPLIRIDDHVANSKDKLVNICGLIRKNPGWNAAHLIAAVNGLHNYFTDLTIIPQINSQEAIEHKTPLHIAIDNCNLNAIKVLVNLKAKMDIPDIYGRNVVIHMSTLNRSSDAERENINKSSGDFLTFISDAATSLANKIGAFSGPSKSQSPNRSQSSSPMRISPQNPNIVVTEIVGCKGRTEVSQYSVLQRCDSLVLHGTRVVKPLGDESPLEYNLILHVPESDRLFSLYRTNDWERAQYDFILFQECLVPLVNIGNHICNKSHLDVITKLVRENAGWTAAHLIAAMDYHGFMSHSTIRPLINVQDPNDFKTPLQVAIEFGRVNTVRALVSLNAQMDLRDSKGNTVIHVAVANTDYSSEILKALINKE